MTHGHGCALRLFTCQPSWRARAAPALSPHDGDRVARPPNYQQAKKVREQARKVRQQDKQQRRINRTGKDEAPASPPAADPHPPSAPPSGSRP